MRDWKTSGQVKIDRANKHIEDLEVMLNDFRELNPYYLMPESNPDGAPGARFTVRVVHDIPPQLSAITADAIHNLHVALDHLWQLTTSHGRSRRGNHFPAYLTPETAEARLAREQDGPAKAAVRLLHSANEFRPGNPCWTIREFDDADKHDTLRLVAGVLDSFWVDMGRLFEGDSWSEEVGFIVPQPRPVLDDGYLMFLTNHPVAEMHPDYEIGFQLAFGEGEILAGQPVVPMVRQLSQSVNGIAEAFLKAGLLT